MRRLARLCGAILLLACLLDGCTGPQALTEPTAPGGCPESLRQGIHITASVAQVAIPDGVKEPSGAVRLIAGLGRRVLIAVEVPRGLPRVRLLSDSLEVLTFGGTLAGWARIAAPATATGHQSIQVSDGLLRITPFLPGGRLGPYTEALDLEVVPGGAAAAGLALRPGRMWDDSGRPTAPHDLGIVLAPILHLKVLDVVDATALFDFTALQRSRPHERWQCSIESDFQLVDHRSALPNLWVLQPAESIGAKQPVLALYKQNMGAFPAIFLSPATAAGFARWLRETHARRVGEYAIGLTSKTAATGFQPASKDDFADFSVQQFGDR
jgi:hypothetical protein